VSPMFGNTRSGSRHQPVTSFTKMFCSFPADSLISPVIFDQLSLTGSEGHIILVLMNVDECRSEGRLRC